MTQDSAGNPFRPNRGTSLPSIPVYYARLDVQSTASAEEIRKAYRLKSKLYHPDTTLLPREMAIQQFQELNQAYAVLSNPEQRLMYDRQNLKLAESSQATPSVNKDHYSQSIRVKSAYLDAEERPLSPGELFALFILGLTFVLCLIIAVILGISRGEMALKASAQTNTALSKSVTPQHLAKPSLTKSGLSKVQSRSPIITPPVKKSAKITTSVGIPQKKG